MLQQIAAIIGIVVGILGTVWYLHNFPKMKISPLGKFCIFFIILTIIFLLSPLFMSFCNIAFHTLILTDSEIPIVFEDILYNVYIACETTFGASIFTMSGLFLFIFFYLIYLLFYRFTPIKVYWIYIILYTLIAIIFTGVLYLAAPIVINVSLLVLYNILYITFYAYLSYHFYRFYKYEASLR